jgi:hypothetical protein
LSNGYDSSFVCTVVMESGSEDNTKEWIAADLREVSGLQHLKVED